MKPKREMIMNTSDICLIENCLPSLSHACRLSSLIGSFSLCLVLFNMFNKCVCHFYVVLSGGR